ncbi:hypothetical protein Dimus_038096 [Dionaea muscipula]
MFLNKKKDTLKRQPELMKRSQNEKSLRIVKIRSDRGTEFLNQVITDFCLGEGIVHQLAAARTPQQNGVAERRNRTLKEVVRTMIAEADLPKRFWAEAINTACCTQNKTVINKLWNERKPSIGYFHIFGGKCFIHNNGKDQLKTSDAKADEGIVMDYSSVSKAFRVLNKRTMVIEETVHVVFDKPHFSGGAEEAVDKLAAQAEKLKISDTKKVDAPQYVDAEIPKVRGLEDGNQHEHGEDDAVDHEAAVEDIPEDVEEENQVFAPLNQPDLRWLTDHPPDLVIGNFEADVRTRRQLDTTLTCFLSQIEPKVAEDALVDADWITAM